MRSSLLLPVVLLGACVSGAAVDVPRLVVPEAPVELGELAFALRSRHEVVLGNPGTAAAQVRLSVSPGLDLLVDAVRVPAGGEVLVDLYVTPQSYDPIAGTLTVRGPERTHTVSITGTVVNDLDGDGFVAVGAGGDDCDDTRDDVFPGADEVCDGRDNDCDGRIDADAIDALDWFSDRDRDGFGDPEDRIRACSRPAGRVADDADCDDTRASVNPDASEIADGIDQNCNGLIDEHLLVARAVPVTEVGLAQTFGGAGFVELRARGSTDLFLEGVTIAVDGVSAALPALVAPPGSSLVLCGSSADATLGDRVCDAPLPAALEPDSQVTLTALTTFEELDLATLTFVDARSLELDPASALAGDSGDPATWCPSTTPLDVDVFASPGTLAGHCEPP